MRNIIRKPIREVVNRFFVSLYVPVIVLGVSIGVIIGLLMGRPDLSIIGFLTVGVPVLFAALIISFQRMTKRSFNSSLMHSSMNINKSISKIFIIIYCMSLVALIIPQGRVWYYILSLGLLAGLLVLSIFVGSSPLVLLSFLSLTLINIIYGVTLNYHLYHGFGDIFPHILYSEIIYDSGSILPQEIVHYSTFPLYHIFVAMGSHLFGASVQTSLFLLTGAAYISLVWIVFSMFHRLDDNTGTAMLTTILFLCNPYVIFYGTYMITRSMAFVGITLLFLLFLKMKTENSYWMFLFLLVLLFVTLSHQVSILQFLFLFGVLLACSHIVGERLIIKPMHLVILSVAPALHWIFFSLDFVEVTILNRIVGGVSTEAQVTDTAGQSLHHAIYYVNTYIIILLSVVGIYVIYTTSDKKWLRAIALFGLVTAPIYLPSPITSIPQADIFRFDRFILILSPFVSYLMARGLIGSLSIMSLKKRWGPIKRMVVVLVIVLFLLSSILIPVNTPNGADIEEASWTGPPVHFSNSEQQGLEQIDQKLVSNENIYSDHYSIRYLERNTLEPENEYETLDINNSSHRSNSVVVLREDSLRTDGIMIEDNATRGEYNDISLIEHHQSSNKIYSNEALVGYNW